MRKAQAENFASFTLAPSGLSLPSEGPASGRKFSKPSENSPDRNPRTLWEFLPHLTTPLPSKPHCYSSIPSRTELALDRGHPFEWRDAPLSSKAWTGPPLLEKRCHCVPTLRPRAPGPSRVQRAWARGDAR